ncbi:MAG: TAT-variant-translocated molybdopterin oxidoreductase, partial [Candidatus Eisenbacteria bacterium]|nr:TAT-variant-translocated molybdopterin oxidoreductase [Candidatus Eisenbacteria bacterium]
MSRQAAPASGAGTKLFWRSLEDHAGTPEFQAMVEREFPGETWEKLPPATRRSFLKVMGASMAMAGLAGCRWPKEKIVPFSRSPEYTPGNPLAYATSMEIAGVGTGLLVTSFDGRPIKIEGNPDHPASRGATDLFAQALVLELYDPSRSKDVARRDGSRRQASDWDAFESFAREHFGAMRGGATAAAAGAVAGSSVNGSKFRILSEASGSPSMAAMREALLAAYPGAVWHEYEPLSRDGERAGTAIAFGRPYRPQLFLDRADVVVCLDDDLLVRHPDAVRMSRDLMSGRSADSGRMNRLYAIESAYTNTGSVADHRFAVPASLTGVVAARLAEALADEGAIGPAGAIAAPFAGHPYRPVFVKTIARDLAAARGRCVLTVGPRQPAAVHALVHHLNAALGNIGKTIDYTADPEPDRASHVDSIRDLAAAIDAGSVETLLVLGGNPVYDAPVDLDLGARIARVPHTIRLGLFEDETSAVCRWHLPRAHTLESWGDVRAWDGTVSLMQPLILPLYGGRSGIEVLSLLVDPTTPRTGHEIVRSLHQANDEAAWRTLLERGVLEGSAWPLETPAQSDPG